MLHHHPGLPGTNTERSTHPTSQVRQQRSVGGFGLMPRGSPVRAKPEGPRRGVERAQSPVGVTQKPRGRS